MARSSTTFKKGNKAALGNNGGRPRVIPEAEELIELGKDLVEWISEPTKDPKVIWAEWYAVRHGYIMKEWKLFKDKPEFKPYYEQARALMAKNLLKNVAPSYGNRMLRHYFQEEVKEAEDDLLKFEADLKKQENQEVNETYIRKYQDLMLQLQELKSQAPLREKKTEANTEDSANHND